jgi:uncharacterized coiled-coil protein SlyX
MDMQVKELQRIVDTSRKDLYKMQQKLRLMERRIAASEQKVSALAIDAKAKKTTEIAVEATNK